MLKDILFFISIDSLFLLSVFLFLSIVKAISQNKELRREISRMRFVLATIVTGIGIVQVVLEVACDTVLKKAVPLDIISILIWVKICLREYNSLKK